MDFRPIYPAPVHLAEKIGNSCRYRPLLEPRSKLCAWLDNHYLNLRKELRETLATLAQAA